MLDNIKDVVAIAVGLVTIMKLLQDIKKNK